MATVITNAACTEALTLCFRRNELAQGPHSGTASNCAWRSQLPPLGQTSANATCPMNCTGVTELSAASDTGKTRPPSRVAPLPAGEWKRDEARRQRACSQLALALRQHLRGPCVSLVQPVCVRTNQIFQGHTIIYLGSSHLGSSFGQFPCRLSSPLQTRGK